MSIGRRPRRIAGAVLVVAALVPATVVLLDDDDETTVITSGDASGPSPSGSGPSGTCDDPPFRPTHLPGGWSPAVADRAITEAHDGIRSAWWDAGSGNQFIRVTDRHSTFPQVPELTEEIEVLGQRAWIGPFSLGGGYSVEFQACGQVWSLNSQGLDKPELRRVAEGLRRSGNWPDQSSEPALTVWPPSAPTGYGILVEGRGVRPGGGESPEGVPVYLARSDNDYEWTGLVGYARIEGDGTFRLAAPVPAILTAQERSGLREVVPAPGHYELVVGDPKATLHRIPFEVASLIYGTASYSHPVVFGCDSVTTFLGGHYWRAEPLGEHSDLAGRTPGFFTVKTDDEAEFRFGDYHDLGPLRFRRVEAGEVPASDADCPNSERLRRGPAPVPPPCPAGATEPSFESGRYCGPEAPPGNGLGPDGQCTGEEAAPPCGPGAEPGKYYAYTLPLRCGGIAHFNGERWYSMLPPPTDGGTVRVWMRLDPGGKLGWISSQGAVALCPTGVRRPRPAGNGRRGSAASGAAREPKSSHRAMTVDGHRAF